MKTASWYFKSSLMIFILFIAFEAAQAQVSITYSSREKHYFTITIQDNWRVNIGSEIDLSQITEDKTEPARIISAMPNDGMPLWFGMWVPKELKKIKGAKEYMASLGLNLLTEVVTTERKFDTLNSMETYSVSGTGKKEGETMDFHAVFFQLSPESVAIAIYIGPPDTTSRHGEELLQMIHSIQPVLVYPG